MSRTFRASILCATVLLLSAAPLFPASSAYAKGMSHSDSGADAATSPSVGQTLLEKVLSLTGTWDAKMGSGVLTDVFRPFALGTAVLGEEWLNGKQITTTVFYVVDGQLYADHFCDFKNQPRYTAVPSLDPNVLDFEFRSATNLDTHPMHFHDTKWKIVDATHLIQDWYILGGKKPVSLAHLEFTKRQDGSGPASPPAGK
ncbi:MAG: hypothetical protein ACREVO_03355 [Steroidobacteraceae bacterium]